MIVIMMITVLQLSFMVFHWVLRNQIAKVGICYNTAYKDFGWNPVCLGMIDLPTGDCARHNLKNFLLDCAQYHPMGIGTLSWIIWVRRNKKDNVYKKNPNSKIPTLQISFENPSQLQNPSQPFKFPLKILPQLQNPSQLFRFPLKILPQLQNPSQLFKFPLKILPGSKKKIETRESRGNVEAKVSRGVEGTSRDVEGTSQTHIFHDF